MPNAFLRETFLCRVLGDSWASFDSIFAGYLFVPSATKYRLRLNTKVGTRNHFSEHFDQPLKSSLIESR